MNQSEKRQFLIRSLLQEHPEYRDMGIPADTNSQRQLFRGLMNIRAPRRIGADFLKTQDAYLPVSYTHLNLENLQKTKADRATKADAIGAFIFRVQELDTLTEFDEKLWLTIIDTVTVRADGRMTFHFQSGVEIAL